MWKTRRVIRYKNCINTSCTNIWQSRLQENKFLKQIFIWFLFVKPFHNWYQIIKWRAWLQFWFSLNCGDHFRLSPFLPFTRTYILINGIKLHVAPRIAVLNMYAKSTFLSITFLKEAWRRSNNSFAFSRSQPWSAKFWRW